MKWNSDLIQDNDFQQKRKSCPFDYDRFVKDLYSSDLSAIESYKPHSKENVYIEILV